MTLQTKHHGGGMGNDPTARGCLGEFVPSVRLELLRQGVRAPPPARAPRLSL
jgi:hypothetical protein